ncbi:MAG: site-2 protease family protein [Candidatus Omnitrophica bacterium]|nr:site-2 protease family protein [Candidatus Omnitrophota bacterium]MDE2009957.1 site-2 protease family protein [Candidatus Omnitrophota bacterium]MDE2213935.1 site-2 protease family protein [Candidatus Omnitrophota bacterium]MDE2231915.1 site-2 protease family protein [Candidatus Omnitrophota bacterium]
MALFVFIIILSILILVHEWGHFIVARKCGVRVEQFSMGFGPKLFSWKRGDTEYCLSLFPLGGFVKMAGDERDKCVGAKDEYFTQPPGRRALIVLMGPVVNLVFAYLCFWCVFKIGYVDMDLSTQKIAPVIGQVLAQSPARQAGLKVGDRILKVNGKPIEHWSQLQDITTAFTGRQLALTVERGKHDITVDVTPQETKTQDIFGRTHETRRIGVAPMAINSADDLVIRRYGFFESFVKAGQELWDITVKTYAALYQMAIGERSPKEAMGIIGMFFVIKFALTIGFSFVLHIVGIISASLALINLLPVVPLDGGHLFLLGLEKWRGRALSERTDLFMARTGFTLIIMLMVFVFYSDFERVGWIDKIVHLFKGMGL